MSWASEAMALAVRRPLPFLVFYGYDEETHLFLYKREQFF